MQHFIGAYGYLAIFILMVAESACIPVPSELTMPLAGALAAGAVPGVHLSLVLVVAVGVAGNVVGSYVAWAVGRYGGQTAWRRLTRFVAGTDDGMARAQRWFDRNGARSVLIGRLLPVIRTFISLPAGFARMSPVRFGLYTVAGCVPWIAGLAWAGWAAGANWHRVTGLVQEAGYVVGGLVVVLMAVAIIVVVRARHRHRRAAANVAARRHRRSQRPGSRRAGRDSGRSEASEGRLDMRGASGGAGVERQYRRTIVSGLRSGGSCRGVDRWAARPLTSLVAMATDLAGGSAQRRPSTQGRTGGHPRRLHPTQRHR